MMAAVRIAAILLAATLTALLTAPASLVATLVAHHSGDRVILADAEGPWWNGSAWVSLKLNGQSALTLPGRIHWVFEPLARGFRVGGAPWLDGSFLAYWHAGPVLTKGQANLPASALQQLGIPFSLLRPTGQLAIRWENAERIRIDWLDAASPLAVLPRLGDFRLDWQPGQWQLTTLRGPLQIDGEAAGGQPFSGTARSDPEAADKLAALLNMLGPTHNGITTLNF